MNPQYHFDLNFLPHENDAIDFNDLPNVDQYEKEGVLEGNNPNNLVLESNQEVEEDILVRGTSSSTCIHSIDPNIQPNKENYDVESNQEPQANTVTLAASSSSGVHSNEEENQPSDIENDDVHQGGSEPRTYKLTSTVERKLIYSALLARSLNGKLKRNSTKEVASLLSVPLRIVQQVWKLAKATPTGTVVNPSHRWPRNSGRKRIEVDLSRIADIPLSQRTTLRSLGHALGISHSTLFSRLKQGLIRRHSNAIRPHLKEENMISRLRFCISMLESSSLPHEPKFVGMYDMVHIDEKWFYTTKKSRNFYLLLAEKDPLRSCQSKNFIDKVMFLTAIARLRFDAEGNEVFSGKIGVFPLMTVEPALRRSRNREARTMETKPIIHVKKEIIRAFLLENIIPAIQEKWPREGSNATIFIQQDNARTHVRPTDMEFQLVASQNGFDIRLLCQPPNSPDLNVLDLGFFNAIHSLQAKEHTKTMDELIGVVLRAFDKYPTEKINHVFLSLQLCMREIMIVEGSNDYKIPHINKLGLERNGGLPTQITCDRGLVENTMSILGRNEIGNE